MSVPATAAVQEENSAIKKADDVLSKVFGDWEIRQLEIFTEPCVFYSNPNRQAAIQMLKLDAGVLTIYFRKAETNLDSESVSASVSVSEPEISPEADPDFINKFLEVSPICERGSIDTKITMFQRYSPIIATVQTARHPKKTFESFCQELETKYRLPVKVITHLKQNAYYREETAEEAAFYSKLKDLNKGNADALLKQAAEIDKYKFDSSKKRYIPDTSIDRKDCSDAALYALGIEACKQDPRWAYYQVFGCIADSENNPLYQLANFHMGQIILQNTDPKKFQDLKDPAKYHARAMKHLLSSTITGSKIALEKLNCKDVLHAELANIVHRFTKLSNSQSSLLEQQIRDRMSALKTEVIAKLQAEDRTMTAAAADKLNLDVKSRGELVLSDGGGKKFSPNASAASATAVVSPSGATLLEAQSPSSPAILLSSSAKPVAKVMANSPATPSKTLVSPSANPASQSSSSSHSSSHAGFKPSSSWSPVSSPASQPPTVQASSPPSRSVLTPVSASSSNIAVPRGPAQRSPRTATFVVFG